MNMKITGNIKLYRKEINLWKRLTDQELRIYILLRLLADWDKNHKDSFGIAKGSLRHLTEYLPSKGSSVPKLSAVIKTLEKKGFIKRVSDGRIRVENYAVFRLSVHSAEQCIQYLEQGVQPPEHLVQNIEEEQRKFIDEKRRFLARKLRSP